MPAHAAPPSSAERLGLLLAHVARSWRTRLDHRLKPLGLSQGKWIALVHLARGADKLTQREIAARIGVEEPTLAGTLRRLEQDGWISRKNCRSDRRCKTVHLQPRAAGVLQSIFETARGLRAELLAEIPPRDLDTCVRVLEQILERSENLDGTSRTNGSSEHAATRKV